MTYLQVCIEVEWWPLLILHHAILLDICISIRFQMIHSFGLYLCYLYIVLLLAFTALVSTDWCTMNFCLCIVSNTIPHVILDLASICCCSRMWMYFICRFQCCTLCWWRIFSLLLLILDGVFYYLCWILVLTMFRSWQWHHSALHQACGITASSVPFVH